MHTTPHPPTPRTVTDSVSPCDHQSWKAYAPPSHHPARLQCKECFGFFLLKSKCHNLYNSQRKEEDSLCLVSFNAFKHRHQGQNMRHLKYVPSLPATEEEQGD